MIEWVLLLWQALLGRVTGPDADPTRLSGQPVRRRLIGLISDRPGIHASQLCREMDESWGTVQYHLGLLRKADMVYSTTEGRERQFFPPGLDPEHARLVATLRRGRRSEIARFIHANPGTRQVDICREVAVSRKTFRASIDPLVGAGLVRERRGLQTNQYFPGDSLDLLLDDAELVDGRDLTTDLRQGP